jgi:DinB superfamily
MAATSQQDILELFEHVFDRFIDRMAGLTEAELVWAPVADADVSLHWRLEHIALFLSEPRNGPWLGQPEPTASLTLGPPDPTLNSCRAAYHLWRAHLHLVTEDELAEPIGEVAGPYGEGTRRSFALHVLDELIHHTAEAALLRDLYPR